MAALPDYMNIVHLPAKTEVRNFPANWMISPSL
jgi:hypothetical protein